MANSRDGSRGAVSVGGPGGIHIEGSNVQLGGAPIVRQSAPTAVVSVDLGGAGALLARRPGVAIAAMTAGAGTILVGAAVVISVLQLPWILLAGPATLCATVVTAGLAVVFRARKRVTTGGVDPDVERRILDVAMTYGGRVTVTAVARALTIPMAEADAALSALARSGHVGVDNDAASGVVLYVFPDIEAGLLPMRRLP